MKQRDVKNCVRCSAEFSCPKRNETQYAISRKEWATHNFCSRLCANRTNTSISGLGRRGKCSEKMLSALRSNAQKRKGLKRSPFTKEWIDNLSKSHLGQVAWNKGMKGFLSGDKSPHWKGGITPIKRALKASVDWKLFRVAVFERDNYTCQECGTSGGYIEPHHIVPLRSRLDLIFEVTNGITLCRPCHVKTMWKEEEFIEKYSQISSSKVMIYSV